MCGIFGYFDYQSRSFQLPTETFSRLIDKLSHRGPDGAGQKQWSGVGLGHRRLAIIDVDLSRGSQPMSDHSREIWISYNGEIYNYRELRAELKKHGVVFRTETDTEVIIQSYRVWGFECLHKFRGIFAFAIWDTREDLLWLVRDQVGVKPLFFSNRSGKIFFSSELAPLLSLREVSGEVDLNTFDTYLSLGYAAAPATGYREIEQLLPGEYLVVRASGVKRNRYWRLDPGAEKHKGTDKDLLQNYRDVFAQAVRRQLIADVPVGVFLSSGTDSFAVAAEALDQGATLGTAYTIAFQDKRYDELPGTKLSAEALNLDLESDTVPDTVEREFYAWQRSSGEFFADSSAKAVYALCRATARRLKVVLSGDGADELLAGYSTYRATEYAALYRRLPGFMREIINSMFARLPEWGGRIGLRETALRFHSGAIQGNFRDHCYWRELLTADLKERLYLPATKQCISTDPFAQYSELLAEATAAGCDRLDACLFADFNYYLPNDLLVKMDRMGMAHSLEVRVPFLDLDVVEFCWRLPTHLKMHAGTGKRILRSAIGERYPAALRRQRKKGFNVEVSNEISALQVQNQYMRNTKLPISETYGRSHFMMLRHLLDCLPKAGSETS